MSKFFKTKFVKKVIVLLIASLVLNSCGNKPSDPGSSNESNQKKEIKKRGIEQYSNTPKFCLVELLELLKLNPDKFQDHLFSKGYVFLESEKGASVGGTIYSYSFPNDKNEVYGAIYKDFNEGLDSPTGLNWSTFNKDDYLEIKNQAEKIGFKYWNTSEIFGGMAISYKNDNETVTFLMETKNGKTIYVIEVRCLPERFKK